MHLKQNSYVGERVCLLPTDGIQKKKEKKRREEKRREEKRREEKRREEKESSTHPSCFPSSGIYISILRTSIHNAQIRSRLLNTK
jgi:hypothetical protein